MEKEELRSKIKEIVNNEQFLKALYEDIEDVINSGMANVEGAEDGYGLAKIMVFCGLRKLAYQYKPYTGSRLEKENKDLIRFYESY